jgi:hypothetical protein
MYGPSMAGLWVGFFWSASLIGNVWTALHYRDEAETTKEAAATEDRNAEITSELKADDRGDTVARVHRHLKDASSPMAVRLASWRGQFTAFSMLYNFSAGALGFVFAYCTGTLNTAISTFGPGFMGMIIVALVLLKFTRTLEARRLADHFITANLVSAAVSLPIGIVYWQQNSVYSFRFMCIVHWSACLYSGIALVLEQSSLE